MNNIKIYALIEPITLEIKYIGKTKQELSKRLYAHIHESKTSNTKKNRWIKSLMNKNLKPKIEEIDFVPESEWEFWEIYWISQFKTWGFELKNTDEGGKGQSSEFMKKNNPMFKKEIVKRFLSLYRVTNSLKVLNTLKKLKKKLKIIMRDSGRIKKEIKEQ